MPSIRAHINGSWTGPNTGGGSVPAFNVGMDAPANGGTLVATVAFVANPKRISDGASTNEFNTYLTSVELWRGTAASPIAKVGDMTLGGYGWTYNYDSTLLADGLYDFHAKFTLTDATVKLTASINVNIDNVVAPPPSSGDTHSKVRSLVYLCSGTDATAKQNAWGDPFQGFKNYGGGRTWSEWVNQYKSQIDGIDLNGPVTVMTHRLGPQNDTIINAISGTTNPTITTAQSMELQTGDTITLWSVKDNGSHNSVLNSTSGGRRSIVVTRNSATSFTLQGVTFEGNYNTSSKGKAQAGWGQIELAAGAFDTYIRQVRDYLLAKLAGFTSGQRAAFFARCIHSPWHELNGAWYIQANRSGLTYDGRTGAYLATRNAWRRLYRILMYEESGYSGAVPTSARTGSMANLYGARCWKWRWEVANFDTVCADAFDGWPGDEYVDEVAMNMYAMTYGGQTTNCWDGTAKGLSASTSQSVTRRGVALGILPSGYLSDGKGDCQKRALEFLAAWCRNTALCRQSTGGGAGDTRTLKCSIGEWSPVALKTTLTYTSDAIPLQQIQGVYDWAVANADILGEICLFDNDKDEGYFAVLRPMPGYTPRSPSNSHGLAADANYRAHTGLNTARSGSANVPSHRPTVSNKFLDVFGRR